MAPSLDAPTPSPAPVQQLGTVPTQTPGDLVQAHFVVPNLGTIVPTVIGGLPGAAPAPAPAPAPVTAPTPTSLPEYVRDGRSQFAAGPDLQRNFTAPQAWTPGRAFGDWLRSTPTPPNSFVGLMMSRGDSPPFGHSGGEYGLGAETARFVVPVPPGTGGTPPARTVTMSACDPGCFVVEVRPASVSVGNPPVVTQPPSTIITINNGLVEAWTHDPATNMRVPVTRSQVDALMADLNPRIERMQRRDQVDPSVAASIIGTSNQPPGGIIQNARGNPIAADQLSTFTPPTAGIGRPLSGTVSSVDGIGVLVIRGETGTYLRTVHQGSIREFRIATDGTTIIPLGETATMRQGQWVEELRAIRNQLVAASTNTLNQAVGDLRAVLPVLTPVPSPAPVPPTDSGLPAAPGASYTEPIRRSRLPDGREVTLFSGPNNANFLVIGSGDTRVVIRSREIAGTPPEVRWEGMQGRRTLNGGEMALIMDQVSTQAEQMAVRPAPIPTVPAPLAVNASNALSATGLPTLFPPIPTGQPATTARTMALADGRTASLTANADGSTVLVLGTPGNANHVEITLASGGTAVTMRSGNPLENIPEPQLTERLNAVREALQLAKEMPDPMSASGGLPSLLGSGPGARTVTFSDGRNATYQPGPAPVLRVPTTGGTLIVTSNPTGGVVSMQLQSGTPTPVDVPREEWTRRLTELRGELVREVSLVRGASSGFFDATTGIPAFVTTRSSNVTVQSPLASGEYTQCSTHAGPPPIRLLSNAQGYLLIEGSGPSEVQVRYDIATGATVARRGGVTLTGPQATAELTRIQTATELAERNRLSGGIGQLGNGRNVFTTIPGATTNQSRTFNVNGTSVVITRLPDLQFRISSGGSEITVNPASQAAAPPPTGMTTIRQLELLRLATTALECCPETPLGARTLRPDQIVAPLATINSDRVNPLRSSLRRVAEPFQTGNAEHQALLTELTAITGQSEAQLRAGFSFIRQGDQVVLVNRIPEEATSIWRISLSEGRGTQYRSEGIAHSFTLHTRGEPVTTLPIADATPGDLKETNRRTMLAELSAAYYVGAVRRMDAAVAAAVRQPPYTGDSALRSGNGIELTVTSTPVGNEYVLVQRNGASPAQFPTIRIRADGTIVAPSGMTQHEAYTVIEAAILRLHELRPYEPSDDIGVGVSI